MTLALNIATRGRPDLLRWTVETTLKNMGSDSYLMVSVDDDDEPTVKALGSFPKDRRLILSVKPREDSIGAKWNRVLDINAFVYVPMVDYRPFVVKGFDQEIIEAADLFPDGIGVVNIGMANVSFPCLQGITRALVTKLGYVYPEHFPYWFVDHWIDDIARMIDRYVLIPDRGDGSRRPGTQEYREPRFWATVYNLLQDERHEQARQIINSADFAEPVWRKQALLANFAMTDLRAKFINQQVAADGARGPPGDERYARLKAKALQTIAPEIARMKAQLAAAEAA